MAIGDYSPDVDRGRYTETEILVAIMEAAPDRAEDLVKDMYPSERAALAEWADALERLVFRVRRERGELTWQGRS